MLELALSLATTADLPGIAIVTRNAFRDSPHTMSYWMFPQDNQEGIYNWRLRMTTNLFNNNPACTYVKVIDKTTGKVVAFALWEKPHPRETEEEKAKKEAEKNEKDEELPKGTNIPLMQDFDKETQRMRSKYVSSENDYVLRAVATLPEYQGKGCASMLLKSGLEKVDAEGAKVFLEATPQGLPLYTKLGWKAVDEFVFDIEKYVGKPWVQKTTCMMREVPMQTGKATR